MKVLKVVKFVLIRGPSRDRWETVQFSREATHQGDAVIERFQAFDKDARLILYDFGVHSIDRKGKNVP